MTNSERDGRTGRLVKLKLMLHVEAEAPDDDSQSSLFPVELLLRLPEGTKLVNPRSKLMQTALSANLPPAWLN